MGDPLSGRVVSSCRFALALPCQDEFVFFPFFTLCWGVDQQRGRIER